MTTGNLLLAIGVGVGLLALAQSSQKPQNEPVQPQVVPPKQPQTQAPISLSSGGGGYVGGSIAVYSNSYGTFYGGAAYAHAFADWVAGIPVNEYPQQTGVIHVSDYAQ